MELLEEIHCGFEDFPFFVRKGKTYKERKEIFWRCYAVNPKKEEIDKLSLQDMVDYIKETDTFWDDDKRYVNTCIKLIKEFENESK